MTVFARTPWTDTIVANLTRRQEATWLQPYTCGKDSGHGDLVPTHAGWVCPTCDYIQDWAHQHDADGTFPPPPAVGSGT